MKLVELVHGAIGIDPSGRRLFLYNDTAAFVLLSLQAGYEAVAIAADLSATTAVSLDTAAASVRALLDEWATTGAELQVSASIRHTLVDAPRIVASSPVRRYLICGQVVETTIGEEQVRTHVEATLAPFLTTPVYEAGSPGPNRISLTVRDGPEPYVLYVAGIERLRLGTAPEATGAVFQNLLEAIRPGVPWLALLHGAAVTAPDGQAIILSGAGGSGKSTLAAVLSRRGYGFLSDDLVALRAPDGAVVPWPLPHSLKRGSWPALAALYPDLADAPIARVYNRDVRFVAAADEDWQRAPAPVAAIVFPRFVPDGEDAIETLTAFDALRRLIDDRLWLGETLTPGAVRAFVAWLEQVPAFAIQYGSSAGAERLIRSVLA